MLTLMFSSTGKKRVEIEKKRGPQKKPKKKKKAPGKGGMKAEESELALGEEMKGGAGSGAEEGQSDNEEEEEKENTDAPSVTGNGPSFSLSSLAVFSASSHFCASSAVFEMSLRLSGCCVTNNLYHWGHRLVQREQCGHTWH